MCNEITKLGTEYLELKRFFINFLTLKLSFYHLLVLLTNQSQIKEFRSVFFDKINLLTQN